MKTVVFLLMTLFILPRGWSQELLEQNISAFPKNTNLAVKKDLKVFPKQTQIQLGVLPSGEKCYIQLFGAYVSDSELRIISEKKEFTSISANNRFGGILLLKTAPTDEVVIYCDKENFKISDFVKALEETFTITFPNPREFP